jgi:AcrR family transcriptional regulator
MNVFNDDAGHMARGSAGAREEGKARTRRAILLAGREVFEEAGFDRASVRGIAEAAGVSPGTVLHHFGSKRELLYAAFHADLNDALEAACRAARHDPPEGGDRFEDRLSRLAETIFAHHERRPALSRTLLRESLFAEPPWDARFQAQTVALHQEVASLAAEAVGRGEIAPEVDLELLALAWVSFYYFALLAWSKGAHGAPERLIHRQMAQHLDGLRLSPTSRNPVAS